MPKQKIEKIKFSRLSSFKTQKVFISIALKNKFSSRKIFALVKEFVDDFSNNGKRFTEKRIGDFDVIYCHVPERNFYLLLEEEW